MNEKDLDKLSLGLCLMVFNFDLIIFTAVASMGAFIVFQVANKYSIKQLKIFSMLSIGTMLTSYMLTRFSNVPTILLLKIVISIIGIYSLVNVFLLSIPYIMDDVTDLKITTNKLVNGLKLIAFADILYVVALSIPLLAFYFNIPMLESIASLLIRSDVATSIMFLLLIIKYLFSKSYRDLNFIHRQYSLDEK